MTVGLQVLEKEFEVALADLSKAEMDVKEKRLAVTTYEQKMEESKRQLAVSEAKLAELKKNVDSVREKVLRWRCQTTHLKFGIFELLLGSQISQR